MRSVTRRFFTVLFTMFLVVGVAGVFVVFVSGTARAQGLVNSSIDSLPTLPGELRFELQWALANPGSTITFAIPGPGPHNIILNPANGPLPVINVQVLINGSTQPNTIEIDGLGLLPGSHGLDFQAGSDNSVVVNVSVINFIGVSPDGVGININQANNITLDNNWVGLDFGGFLRPNQVGVYIGNNSNNNIITGNIGGPNVISGNAGEGIKIVGSTGFCAGNVITGNYIGTDPSGTVQRANGSYGIQLIDDCNSTVIGGQLGPPPFGTGNLISGNGNSGVRIGGTFSQPCGGNIIAGNYIGTDVTGGPVGIGNAGQGIELGNNVLSTTIGGTAAGYGNVISNNNGSGVYLDGSTSNDLQRNHIGTDVAGTSAMPNGGEGVYLLNSADYNTIGGSTGVERNIISGNTGSGIFIAGSNGNDIQGNYIGTNVNGTADLQNDSDGVNITAGSTGNTVGGTTSGHGNVISGNNDAGIEINNSTGNTVSANYIGTNANGDSDVPNNYGVFITTSANNNTIGGINALERNVISGNWWHGVYISSSASNGIQGNYIGTDETGLLDLGNNGNGIYLDGANTNTIGGSSAGHRNIISGNDLSGVLITASSGNNVQGNYIGTQVNGTSALDNSADGVELTAGSTGNTIGGTTTDYRNVISGNTDDGVEINNSTGNTVSANYIGTNANGDNPVANQLGVYIHTNSDNNTIGGDTAGKRNVISGNINQGIIVRDTTGCVVSGNYIGVNKDGNHTPNPVANGDEGVVVSLSTGSNTVGGTTAGKRNVISGNADGVEVWNADDTNIQGNYIGTDATGTIAVANNDFGVFIDNTSTGTAVGGTTAGHRNVISGNDGGVGIWGSTGSTVQGNYIGTTVDGSTPLPNTNGPGVWMTDSSDNTTVGGSAAGANVINNNSEEGVWIGTNTDDCEVSYNLIWNNTLNGVCIGANSND